MDDVQETIRRNVKVLLALRGMSGARQLAAHLGVSENAASQKLSGRRNWQLEDLPKLAIALGVDWTDLGRPVTELVAAAAATTGQSTVTYSPRSSHLHVVSSQARASASDYEIVTPPRLVLVSDTREGDDADAA